MNIQSVSCGYCNVDTEYQRIIRELLAYGVEPSGNKSADKAKLEKLKQAKANKEITNINFVSSTGESAKAQAESSEDNLKSQNAYDIHNMTGASQVAEYNRYKILGII